MTEHPKSQNAVHQNQMDISAIIKQFSKPSHVLITAGMPYANGPLHLGHLAGTQVPADIYTRFMRMLIGAENVLMVCGTDDHGSTSELAALQAGKPVQDFISEIHTKQKETMKCYSISVDVYTGTSRPECFPLHSELAQDFIRRLHRNGMLEKKTSRQSKRNPWDRISHTEKQHEDLMKHIGECPCMHSAHLEPTTCRDTVFHA